MNDRLILDILSDKKYYNVIAILLACDQKPVQGPLKEAFGEPEAFSLLGKTMGYKSFSSERDLKRNPIALTPCGHIYRDHFQLAGAWLAGKREIGTITKKIPCEFMVYDSAWAKRVLSQKNFAILDEYYDNILGRPKQKITVLDVKVSAPDAV